MSGDTYSLGENYKPERVIPNWQGGSSAGAGGNTTIIHLDVNVASGVNPVEVGRQTAEHLGRYLTAGGTVTVRGKTVLSAG